MARSSNWSRDKVGQAKRRTERDRQPLGRWFQPVLERLLFCRQAAHTLALTYRRVWPQLEVLEDRCLPSATITDLGTLGVLGEVGDINDVGQVVGAYYLGPEVAH